MKRFYGLAGGLALAGTASAALLLSNTATTGGASGSTSAIANWVSLGSPLQATAEEPMAAALAASISVERVPRDADSSNQAAWWVPIALAPDGTLYVAFDSPPASGAAGSHEVKIGKRDTSGTWTFAVLRNPDGTVWTEADDIGHKQPTIVVDGAGVLHVWADMHNLSDGMRYFRADAPGGMSFTRQSDIPATGLYTYPVAKRAPNGDVYLMIRSYDAATYDGEGELYRWAMSGSSGSWSHVGTFAAANDAVVYPDDMTFGSDGSIHLLWEWAKSLPRSLRHYGSYLRYSPTGGGWSYADGTAATLPVGLANAKLFFLPLQSGEVFTTDQTLKGLQSAKLALDDYNQPTIAYRYRPTDGSGDANFDVWRVRWSGTSWSSREKIYTASNNVPAALGISRTAAQVRVYFATTGEGLRQGLKTSTASGWTITDLAPGKAITRLATVPLSADTDIIYGAAPTDVNSTTGSIYLTQVTN